MESQDVNLVPGSLLVSEKRNYKVVKVLGAGGFGVTYLAKGPVRVDNVTVDALFAVKELFPCDFARRVGKAIVPLPDRNVEFERCKADFLHEARRLQEIGTRHDNIVKVNEIFEANGTAYYVMQHVNGQSLYDYVGQYGGLDYEFALSLLLPIVSAMEFLHSNRINHFDIKPDNIMLQMTDDGIQPVLIDFGLSVHYNPTGGRTTARSFLGVSEGYSAIEQYSDIKTFSPATDVYGLAATLVYMLTATPPEGAPILRLSDLRNRLAPLIPPFAVDAICHALEKGIDTRTQTATRLRQELTGEVSPSAPQEPLVIPAEEPAPGERPAPQRASAAKGFPSVTPQYEENLAPRELARPPRPGRTGDPAVMQGARPVDPNSNKTIIVDNPFADQMPGQEAIDEASAIRQGDQARHTVAPDVAAGAYAAAGQQPQQSEPRRQPTVNPMQQQAPVQPAPMQTPQVHPAGNTPAGKNRKPAPQPTVKAGEAPVFPGAPAAPFTPGAPAAKGKGGMAPQPTVMEGATVPGQMPGLEPVKETKKSSPLLYIIIGVIVLLALGAGGYFYYTSQQSKPAADEAEQVDNQGDEGAPTSAPALDQQTPGTTNAGSNAAASDAAQNGSAPANASGSAVGSNAGAANASGAAGSNAGGSNQGASAASSAVTTGTVSVYNGTYTGKLLNGKPHGKGRVKFTSKGTVLPHMDEEVFPGYYMDATYSNGQLEMGKIYDADGNLVRTVIP